MGRAGLHTDLADARQVRSPLLQRLKVSVHEGAQLVDIGVLAADFPDLAAHRDGDAVRLVPTDKRRVVRGERGVHLLLLGERGFAEIDQRRGVDVDVVEAGGDLFLDQRAQAVELLVFLGAVVFLRVGLHVIALDEQRPGKAFAQRRADHHGRVLVRPLLGVADFRPRDFEPVSPSPTHRQRSDPVNSDIRS